MMSLFSLQPSARALLTDEFVDGAQVNLPEAVWQPYTQDAEADVDVGAFVTVIDELIHDTAPQDPALDVHGAPRLHKALPLDRRTASDPGVWRYLAIVVRPQLVRHRWRTDRPSTRRSRFWDFGTRPDSNALCRLWWIAELTRDGSDYALTRRVLDGSLLATALFVRDLSEHRPVIEAAVEVLGDAPGRIVELTMKHLQAWLSVSMLERLGRAELVEILTRIRGAVDPAPRS